MPINDSVSLAIPAKHIHIPLAVFAAEQCSVRTGFKKKDINRICLALEEGINHAIEFGYKSPNERIKINISRTSIGVKMEIEFKGLPLDIAKLPKYDPKRAATDIDIAGISFMLIEKLLDKASFSLSPGNKRTVSMEKNLPAHLVTEAEFQNTEPTDIGDTNIHIRTARPEDAESIARLAFKSHGTVLFSEHIYYPDRVRKMIESQEMISKIIETAGKKLAGHGALVRSSPGDKVEELTFGFVDPRFRGLGGASQLVESLENNARERGVCAICSFAVASHVLSQKAALRHGYKESALFLNICPPARAWEKKPQADQPGRIANLLLIKRLQRLSGQTLYPPDHHRRMIEQIYTHAGLAVELREAGNTTAPLPPESIVWTESDFQEGWTAIGVTEYGKDAGPRIAQILAQARHSRMSCVILLLPLVNPLTGAMTRQFEKMGLFFAGVGLDDHGGENLVLQYVNGPAVDYDAVHMASKFADTLKQYVRSLDPSQ